MFCNSVLRMEHQPLFDLKLTSVHSCFQALISIRAIILSIFWNLAQFVSAQASVVRPKTVTLRHSLYSSHNLCYKLTPPQCVSKFISVSKQTVARCNFVYFCIPLFALLFKLRTFNALVKR